MADFARILEAVDRVLGTKGLDRYRDRARNLAADSLTADPFVIAMQSQLAEKFTGTSAELLTRIAVADDKRPPKDWPANARQLTTLLKRQAPVMRRAGWEVAEDRDPHQKVLLWTIARPEIARNEDPQSPRHPHADRIAGVAGVAGVEYPPSQDDEPRPLALVAGNPRCTVCGKANLYHRDSIKRGICAGCIKSQGETA